MRWWCRRGKEKEKEREREGLDAFLRIPVLPQIYDVLIYAHKKHGSSTATLAQAREGGLVSSCLFFSSSCLPFHTLF